MQGFSRILHKSNVVGFVELRERSNWGEIYLIRGKWYFMCGSEYFGLYDLDSSDRTHPYEKIVEILRASRPLRLIASFEKRAKNGAKAQTNHIYRTSERLWPKGFLHQSLN